MCLAYRQGFFHLLPVALSSPQLNIYLKQYFWRKLLGGIASFCVFSVFSETVDFSFRVQFKVPIFIWFDTGINNSVTNNSPC